MVLNVVVEQPSLIQFGAIIGFLRVISCPLTSPKFLAAMAFHATPTIGAFTGTLVG